MFRFWRGILLAFSIATLTVLSAPAVTIHRSFRTREAGVGFGTGTASVAHPVDARIDKAIDEARQKEAAKTKVIIGRCTKVSDGDTITVLDSEKVQHKVRLDRIDAPEKKQAFGEKSKQHLSEMVFGKDVRVEWQKKDRYQRILGIVFIGEKDVNLQMVKDGFAWHYKFYDKTPAYAQAALDAREKKIGLWVDPNPIEPYEFRKSKKGGVR